MDPVFQSFLSGFRFCCFIFCRHDGDIGLGITIYHFVTPYHELHLVRSGNTAAVSISAAIVGMAPLAIAWRQVSAYGIS